MSDPHHSPTHPPPRPPQPHYRRNPLVSILMILAGLMLLLPGLCSLTVAVMAFRDMPSSQFAAMGLWWAICLAISFGGILLLRKAIK